MPPPPEDNFLLWFIADQNVALDGNGRVVSWTNLQTGMPSLAQPAEGARPLFISSVFNGLPGIRFTDGTSLGVQSIGIIGADFTLIVLGRNLSPQSPGHRFLFRQTLTRNIQGDTRPFMAAISLGSDGMALYELDSASAPIATISADISVFCPLTLAYRESLLLAVLCGTPLVQPSTVTGYQLDMSPATGDGFDGILVEFLLYQGSLRESDRATVEQHLEEKYQSCTETSSSSDSSYSSSSDSSSSESSESPSSSEESSSSVSSEFSSSSPEPSSSSSSESSAESSDSTSSESSESSSSESSGSSSLCSCELPPDPVPVTDGLVAWYRSDLHITQSGDQVLVWGGVCDCLPDAVSVGVTPPLITPAVFGEYPGLSFESQQSLQIQAGELAQDSFTVVVVGRATGERHYGGSGTAGQRLLFTQNGVRATPGQASQQAHRASASMNTARVTARAATPKCPAPWWCATTIASSASGCAASSSTRTLPRQATSCGSPTSSAGRATWAAASAAHSPKSFSTIAPSANPSGRPWKATCKRATGACP
ncbi:MAG: hypothetical protein ABIP85_18555 [Chthoniobacteraceae bacterium]